MKKHTDPGFGTFTLKNLLAWFFIAACLTALPCYAFPDTSRATSAASYAVYDSTLHVVHFPAIDVGSDVLELDLVPKISGGKQVFELVPESVRFVTDEALPQPHAVFVPNLLTNIHSVEIPGLYLDSPTETLSLQVTLQLLPDTNPVQFIPAYAALLPYLPGIKTVEQQPSNHVLLEWHPVTASNTPNNITYEVHVAPTSMFVPDDATRKAVLNNVASYTLTDLDAGKDNYVLIIAADADGNQSLERDYHKIPADGSSPPKQCFLRFTNLDAATPNADYVSNTITLCDLAEETEISVSGGASLLINGKDTYSSRASVASGDTLAIKTRSSSNGSKQLTLGILARSHAPAWECIPPL
ncbi:MAG: fibronectin type III domain-containing protein [Gammaproteobacteria bacterium]|nr:fibronectin type III domain-containing protein [Gammaproteobacteria bacterium]